MLDTGELTAINQLYSRYAHAIDDGDGKAFAACFAADGVLDLGADPIAGDDALAAFADGMPTTAPGIRHVVANLLVEGDGDEATGRAYLLTMMGGGPPTFILTGRYTDALRRDDGEWRFVRRTLVPDQ